LIHTTTDFSLPSINTEQIIINENNAPENIDYLSVDTNGSEFKVLEGIDFIKYNFNIITVKNSHIVERQDKIKEILTSNGCSMQQTVMMVDNISDDLYVPNSIYIEGHVY